MVGVTGTDMEKGVYDPNLDGVIALAQTEADMKQSVYDIKGALGVAKNHLYEKIASDTLRHSIDATLQENGTTYVKKKTLTFTNGIKGTIRIKFDLKDGSDVAWGILTQNGATPGGAGDLGVAQDGTTTSYVTQSQDIAVDIPAGETIDLWLKTAAGSAFTENLRFYYNNATAVVLVAATGGD